MSWPHTSHLLQIVTSQLGVSSKHCLWPAHNWHISSIYSSRVAEFKNIFCRTKNNICRPSDGVSDLHTVLVPISGAYLLSLGGNILNHGGQLVLRRNRKEQLLEAGRTDIIDLNEVSCD